MFLFTSYVFYVRIVIDVEKAMATRSSVLAWRIPGTGEPGGLLSMGLRRVGHDLSDLAAAAAAVLITHVIAQLRAGKRAWVVAYIF